MQCMPSAGATRASASGPITGTTLGTSMTDTTNLAVQRYIFATVLRSCVIPAQCFPADIRRKPNPHADGANHNIARWSLASAEDSLLRTENWQPATGNWQLFFLYHS